MGQLINQLKKNKIFNPTNTYDKSVDNPESRFFTKF